MQKIKILDPQEAIKIAAGEVVERPAHILKELVENSVDAGATEIIIHSEQAGKNLLKITDNGCGMSPQDAQLCFAHHATSKISNVQDLDTIATYGFRGEALASITSVAQVSITTKTDKDKSAKQLILEDGAIKEQQTIAHPTGTTIMVKNLFDNIPARKKFLKSNDTEWNAIVAIFQAFCMRYPNIHFKLFHDSKLSYNCPVSSDIIQRSAQLWSNNLHDQLIAINKTEKNNFTISGAISKSHYHRYNRNQIFTFVNNRWVKNIEISRAIIKGYQNVLPPQKYPAAFLFIDINQAEIDINIHPKKEEVKFLHPGIVQKFIQETVTKVLNESVNETLEQQGTGFPISPTLKLRRTGKPDENDVNTNPFAQPHQQAVSNVFEQGNQTGFPIVVGNDERGSENDPSTPKAYDVTTTITNKSENQQNVTINNDPLSKNIIEQNSFDNKGVKQKTNFNVSNKPHTKTNVSPTSSFPTAIGNPEKINNPPHNQTIYEQEPFSIIGQFATTYILIEKAQELILIDQHAAHERILYENFKKNFEQVATVQLLFPHIIKLSETDVSLISKHAELFTQHGIVFEQFSDTELVIQATPVSLQNKAIADIILTTLNWIKEHDSIDEQDFFKQLNEQLHTQKACKTACKAGDTLNQEQMLNIVQTLLIIENRFCCPHGRPTMWNVSLKDIEKHFHRDYRSKNKEIF